MQILIISQVFWPENFRINELCSSFIEKGHSVDVLTGKPNYPSGSFFKGYGLFSKIVSNYNGARIFRVPIFPRGNASGIRLFFNYLSFAIVGSLFAMFFRKKYDFIFVFGVSPITVALPAIIHKKIYETNIYLWVLDLWPESVLDTGRIKGSFFVSILTSLVRYIYINVDRIFISSEMMSHSIRKILDKKEKKEIEYLPNWIEKEYINNFNIKSEEKRKYLPSGFVVLFTGNIGFGQDCPSIVKAAKILKEEINIKIVIVGEGSERKYIEDKIKEFELEQTLFILGPYSSDNMKEIMNESDVLFLSLRNKNVYSYTVPGKLQSYMASSKPIIGMINGESAQIIMKSQCGKVVKAEDYRLFAETIKSFSKLPKARLDQMGINGYKYGLENFSKERIVSTIFKNKNTIET